MKQYFTVTVRYFNGTVDQFEHVSSEFFEYGRNSNYCHFKDKDGRRHIIIGATVTADEEAPESATNAAPTLTAVLR